MVALICQPVMAGFLSSFPAASFQVTIAGKTGNPLAASASAAERVDHIGIELAVDFEPLKRIGATDNLAGPLEERPRPKRMEVLS
jgi:hypothetical protein